MNDANIVLNQHRLDQASSQSPLDCYRALMASASLPGADPSAGWQDAWEAGIIPWDKGQVQHALEELFTENGAEWGFESVRLGRALVPGCGRGYDVLFLTRRVKECWGIDVSRKAIEMAKAWAEAQADTEDCVFSFHVEDFFKFAIPPGSFDLAYDYSFFCAISPSQRLHWAQRYAELINQGGKLITLLYPIDGDRPGGPPFSVDPEDVNILLSRVGFKKILCRMPSHPRHPQLLAFQGSIVLPAILGV
ncbi:hypothetical protein O181_011371 [Austropuccinia psidii MF-1]|uniref:Thiol methyltransferase 2 n=1 Tax=Austropuccinia psidii MF-1 TaxID=1389203 RepID=A0A9Q3GL96_9BASI|nr:hypothetical protein [Austropuccinia psidii MF-1]